METSTPQLYWYTDSQSESIRLDTLTANQNPSGFKELEHLKGKTTTHAYNKQRLCAGVDINISLSS